MGNPRVSGNLHTTNIYRLRCFSIFSALILLVFAGACGGRGRTPVQPPQDNPPPITASPDVRADYVLSKMTQDEKIQLVHGAAGPQWWNQTLPRSAGGFIPGIRHLGVPDLYFEDGSVGSGRAQAKLPRFRRPSQALPHGTRLRPMTTER